MKRNKTQKGITLVALIITIIVLLILSVVAIRAVQGDGIIAHAKNAREQYEQKAAEENSLLSNLTGYITGQLGENETSNPSEPTTRIPAISTPEAVEELQKSCEHHNTEVRNILYYEGSKDKIAYSGDVYCANCDILLSEGYCVTYIDANHEVHFKEGMTWNDFVNSELNTEGWTIMGVHFFVVAPGCNGGRGHDGGEVTSSELIKIYDYSCVDKPILYIESETGILRHQYSSGSELGSLTTFEFSGTLTLEHYDENGKLINFESIQNATANFYEESGNLIGSYISDDKGVLVCPNLKLNTLYYITVNYNEGEVKFELRMTLSGCSIKRIQ